MKNFDLDAIYKKADKITKRITETSKETDKIIKEKYNGDENAYFIDTFNMASASLLTGLSIENIRIILIEKTNDTNRKSQLQNAFHSNNINIRLEYPGGYNAFINDVKNNYFENVSINDIIQ